MEKKNSTLKGRCQWIGIASLAVYLVTTVFCSTRTLPGIVRLAAIVTATCAYAAGAKNNFENSTKMWYWLFVVTFCAGCAALAVAGMLDS